MLMRDYFFDLAEAEFSGKSFNGPSLMKTLEKLDTKAALSTDTLEGYSAWEVALHCSYCHFLVAKSLVNAGLSPGAGLPAFPWKLTDFPPPPEAPDDASWKSTQDAMRVIHKATMDIIRAIPDDKLELKMPEWDIPFGQAIAWLCGHDSYHAAQIRNMGVPGLKRPKA